MMVIHNFRGFFGLYYSHVYFITDDYIFFFLSLCLAFPGRISGERSAAAFLHWVVSALFCLVYDMDDHIRRWSIGV